MAGRISFSRGKGKLTHNSREKISPNVDRSKVSENIIFKNQKLGEAYREVFDGAVEKYNSKQKRKDRKITLKSFLNVPLTAPKRK